MDSLIEWLPKLGALITGLIGLIGLFKPTLVTAGLGIEMTKPLATSEIRGVLGGLNFGGAVAALYLADYEVFIALGIAWVCVTAARVVSIVMDGTSIKDSIPPILIDGTLALLFLSAAL